MRCVISAALPVCSSKVDKSFRFRAGELSSALCMSAAGCGTVEGTDLGVLCLLRAHVPDKDFLLTAPASECRFLSCVCLWQVAILCKAASLEMLQRLRIALLGALGPAATQ